VRARVRVASQGRSRGPNEAPGAGRGRRPPLHRFLARPNLPELEGEPVSLRGDGRLLRRMIRTLLENARRHGAPPIRVRVGRAGDGMEVRVCDPGPGVPASEREAVFRPFYRFAGAAEGAGAGLGLALVRQIARRHGGDARCEGRGPAGSCVVVGLGAGSGAP
jgi:signal transduction histidine kinase